MWHRVAPRLAEAFTVGGRRSPRLRAELDARTGRRAPKLFQAGDGAGHGRGDGSAGAQAVRRRRPRSRCAGRLPDGVRRAGCGDADWRCSTSCRPGTTGRGSTGRADLGIFHWMFLAQPYPFPETLIGGASRYFLEYALKGWSKGGLAAFGEEALAAYRTQISDPGRVRSMCEDYRAGATADVADDEADRAAGRKIAAPLLALWGSTGIARGKTSPVDVWRGLGERTSAVRRSIAAISCRKRRRRRRSPRSSPSSRALSRAFRFRERIRQNRPDRRT